LKKKIIIPAIIVAVIAVAAYFIFFNNEKPFQFPDNTTAFLNQPVGAIELLLSQSVIPDLIRDLKNAESFYAL